MLYDILLFGCDIPNSCHLSSSTFSSSSMTFVHTYIYLRKMKVHEYVRKNQDVAWAAVRAIEVGDVSALAGLMTLAQDIFDRCAAPVSNSLSSMNDEHLLI